MLRFSEIVYNPGDAILTELGIKVDQEAQAPARQTKIREQLLPMNWGDAFD